MGKFRKLFFIVVEHQIGWRDIKTKLAYEGNCYVRDYFRRRDKPSLEGGYKVTEYLEWFRRTTIPNGKKLHTTRRT